MATASASALPTGPWVASSFVWNAQNLSPGNWLRAALATFAASTEPGPSTGKSLRTSLRFGSSFISLVTSGSAPLQKWQL